MTIQNASSDHWPQIKTVGLAGILVTFSPVLSEPANRAAIAFRTAVKDQEWAEIEESNSTLVSAFFRIDLAAHRPEPIIERLHEMLGAQDWLNAPLPDGRTLWRVPTLFGTDRAPELQEAADMAGRSIDEAVRDLSTTTMRALTIGFAPGQPYLGTLPDHWEIPRLSQITPRVPAGALVTAVRQFCLFPYDTPTGWRHVGQTGFLSFRPWADEPFVLRPGDEMIFDPVSETEFAKIEATVTDGLGGAQREAIT
jgi:KipI family sensor histidine kinase inhibitor